MGTATLQRSTVHRRLGEGCGPRKYNTVGLHKYCTLCSDFSIRSQGLLHREMQQRCTRSSWQSHVVQVWHLYCCSSSGVIRRICRLGLHHACHHTRLAGWSAAAITHGVWPTAHHPTVRLKQRTVTNKAGIAPAAEVEDPCRDADSLVVERAVPERSLHTDDHASHTHRSRV